MRDVKFLGAACTGACLFWSVLSSSIMRPSDPHPGLKDDALKQALRLDREHNDLGYLTARKVLFDGVDGDGRRAEGAYTGQEISYFKQPLLNKGAVEHAWPLTRLPETARADLHHMFVVVPEARVARVNLHYDDVLIAVWSQGGSKSGPSRRVVPAFEVRKQRRGDIARAMFYVSTMYDIDIPDHEEKALRRWHHDDPVSAQERTRHDAVVRHQTSRNPFIDHPSLAQRIKDF